MESGARGSSSRRKSMPLKVRLSFGSRTHEKVNGEKKKEFEVISDEGSDSQDDKDYPELPEGTVVVQPEPVQEKSIRFRGPEFKSANKKGGGGGASSNSSATKLDNVFCTACARQVNPWKSGMVKKHKSLKVLICRKCYNFLGSGEIAQDEDGMDEQCRWCGEGGRLTICDKCPRAFCKACIMRNFGRAAFTAVTDSENWECYICDPAPLDELRKQCRTVYSAIEADKAKKLSKSSQPAPATNSSSKSSSSSSSSSARSSSKSQSELADDATSVLTKMFSSVDCDEDTVVEMTNNLLEASTTFRRVLLSIQHAVDKEKEIVIDDDEVPPLFSFSEETNMRQKKQRCAKILRKGLQTFAASAGQILSKKKSSGSSSKSSAFYKSLASVAESKCNGDVKNPSTPQSSSSKRSATSTSASSSSLNSISASTSRASLNSPSVSGLKSSSSRPERGQKSGDARGETVSKKADRKPKEERDKVTEKSSKNTEGAKEKRRAAVEGQVSSAQPEKVSSKNSKEKSGKNYGDSSEEDVIMIQESLDMSVEDAGEDTPPLQSPDNSKKLSSQNLSEESPAEMDADLLPEQEKADDTLSEQEKADDTLSEQEKADDTLSSQQEKEIENDLSMTVSDSFDMSQQEENLFAKLELIRELAEESCKDSEADKLAEDTGEPVKDTVDSDDESLPEVSFGPAHIESDDNTSDKNESSTDKIASKDDVETNEIVNDFSDISDAESDVGKKSKSSKQISNKDTSSKKETVDRSSSKRKEDKSKNSNKKETAKKTEGATLLSDDENSGSGDVSSSDLILSSGEDGDERREKRKRRLKKKKNGSSSNGKPDASGDSEKDMDTDSKTKRRVKTTPKKESHKRRTKLKGSEEEDEDSTSKSTSKSKKSSKSKKNNSDEEESEDERQNHKSKGASKKPETNGSTDKKKRKEKSERELDSSEEDERLEKEIDSLLKGSKKRQKPKKEEEAAKEDEDSDEEEEDTAKSKKKEKDSKGKAEKNKKKGKKKEEDSSDSSDDEKQDDDEEEKEEEEMDDSAEEMSSKPKKNTKGNKAKDSDVENELAKKAMLDELDDEEDDEDEKDEDEDSSSESDIGASKKRKAKKSEDKKKSKKSAEDEDEDESDFEPAGKRKRFRSKLLDAKVSESDSDSEIEVKKRKGKKRKRDSDDEEFSGDKSDEDDDDDDDDDGDSSNSDENSDDEDSLSDGSDSGKKKRKGKGKGKGKGKEKGKKRRRIKKMDSSDEAAPMEGEEDGEDPSSRKKIRKIKSDKKLGDTTKAAAKAEEDRRRRVKNRQEKFNSVETKDVGDGQAPITTKLVLEWDDENEEPLIQVNPKLICKLKPHQVEAVQFMWDCMFESLERSKKEEKSAGCILAHCMGLGKTLSVVSFVHTMMTHAKLTKVKTCLVVSPLNTVLNWQNEFEIWLDEDDQLTVYEMASVKQNGARADVLEDWHKNGGIMIMGYEMLRNLSQGARVRNKKQKAIFNKTLIDPGADIVVCDEGHIMKNAASALSKSMNKIKTRRRVVLTGTPLQNNLIEYHCMVDFVKPNLLGTKKEFANRFVNPIINGQHSDSTPRDVRIMKNRAHVLHELLAGCVQRRDYSALTKFLPPKQEYVIAVRLSDMQIKLYEEYLKRNGQVDGQISAKGAQLFKDYQNLMKIWTHPWVLKLAEIRDELKMKYDDDEDSFIDDELTDEDKSFGSDSSSSSESEAPKAVSEEEESAGEGTSSGRRSRRLRNKDRSRADDREEIVKEWKTRSRGGEGEDWPVEEDLGPQAVSNEWWADYVKEEDQNKMEHSGKLSLLFDILRMCEEIGDKVLIFSQSLLSLNIIEYFLEQVDSKFTEETQDKPDEELKEEFGKRWTKGEDYFRLDGSTSAQMRQHWAGIFNDPENHRARLFLISTRAGGLGINLVGANRVIIFDASWNPSHDVQSIFRVYRFGQTKPCYIYRFLAQGTMEEKIYDRQVNKLSLSQRVVDEHQVERHFTAADLSELYAFKPQHLSDESKKETLLLPKDVLLAEIVSGEQVNWFVAIHEHDSLLENLVEQELTEEEKKAAWDEYENEKKGLVRNVSSMGQGGAGLGSYLSQEFLLQTARNLRMQHPDMPQEVLQMHLQRIIMMQIRQKQEEQRRLELMERQQAAQFMQMQQRYSQLQQQYMQQMGQQGGAGMYAGMMPPMGPGQRFSPSLYAHMAQPGVSGSAFHGGAAAAALNSEERAGTSKDAKKPSSEVIDLDESND